VSARQSQPAHPQRSLQPLRTAELLASLRVCNRSYFSSVLLCCRNFVGSACSSPSVLQGGHFAAKLRLWGDAAGTESRCATLRFAYGCSPWSCCAKRFLSSHPDSCSPAVVTVVSFPLMSAECPAVGSALSAAICGVHTWVAAPGPHSSVSVVRAGHGSVGAGLPRNQPCGASGHPSTSGPKASFTSAVPRKVLRCRERHLRHQCRRQRKTSWRCPDLLGLQEAAWLPRDIRPIPTVP